MLCLPLSVKGGLSESHREYMQRNMEVDKTLSVLRTKGHMKNARARKF